MNDPFPQQASDTKKPTGFFAILHWLVNLIQLKEEEQDAAGIYFGRMHDNDHDR